MNKSFWECAMLNQVQCTLKYLSHLERKMFSCPFKGRASYVVGPIIYIYTRGLTRAMF